MRIQVDRQALSMWNLFLNSFTSLSMLEKVTQHARASQSCKEMLRDTAKHICFSLCERQTWVELFHRRLSVCVCSIVKKCCRLKPQKDAALHSLHRSAASFCSFSRCPSDPSQKDAALRSLQLYITKNLHPIRYKRRPPKRYITKNLHHQTL